MSDVISFCPNCGHSGELHVEAGSCSVISCTCLGYDGQDLGSVTPNTADPEESISYPSFWRRLAAFVIDGIIVGIAGSRVDSLPLATSIFAVLYFTQGTGWSFLPGRTLGQRLLGLTVVDLRGQALAYPRALPRALLRYIPLAIILGSLGIGDVQFTGPLSIINVVAVWIVFFVLIALLVTAIFHPQKRGIHDLLAGTLCVNE